MQWVIEISDKPGKEEPEPAFKVKNLLINFMSYDLDRVF